MHLVIGNLSWDRLINVNTLPPPDQDVLITNMTLFPGGAAGNVAAAMSMAGLKTAIVACIGKDQSGAELLTDMKKFGVSTQLIQFSERPTSEFFAIMEKSGRRNFYLNPDEASFQLSYEHISNLDLVGVVTISFVGCRLELAKRIHTQIGPYSSIDLIANIGFWLASGELTTDEIDFISNLEYVFLNRNELMMLSSEIRDYLKNEFLKVRGSNKQVIVTDGSRQTSIYTSYGEKTGKPRPIKKLVNTLGCGDAFMGAYAANYLIGIEYKEALRRAHHLASKIATIEGERSLFIAK